MSTSSQRFLRRLAILSLATLPAVASAKLPPRLERKVADTVRAFKEVISVRDAEIPHDLMEEAKCIAMLPDVKKGALGVGGSYGKGLVTCRTADGAWSAPAFIEIGGASFGLQIGGELIDLLLVVRNADGMDYLLRDKFTLGADASVAAGPVGRTTSAHTDIQLQAGILTYSRTRGAFIGAALDGAVIKQDKTDNKHLYGRPTQARAILLPERGRELPVPAEARAFVEAVASATSHGGSTS